MIYLLLITISAALLAYIWYSGIGKDTVVYGDGWLTKALFHDKAVHFIIGFALQGQLDDDIVNYAAFIFVVLAAIFYEIVTHWPREKKGVARLTRYEAFQTAWRDIVATTLGAVFCIFISMI